MYLDLFSDDEVLGYIMETIESDPSPYMRCFVARNLVRVLMYITNYKRHELNYETIHHMEETSAQEHMQTEAISNKFAKAIENARLELNKKKAFLERIWKLARFSLFLTFSGTVFLEWKTRLDLLFVCQILRESQTTKQEAISEPPIQLKLKIPIAKLPAPPIKQEEPEPEPEIVEIQDSPVKKRSSPPPPPPEPVKRRVSLQPKLPENKIAECKKILDVLCRHSAAGPFLQPVDPLIVDYYRVIKHPIDLGTIKDKLNEYNLEQEFHNDLLQMFGNCFIYNTKDSPIYKMGKQLESRYQKLTAKKEVPKPDTKEPKYDEKLVPSSKKRLKALVEKLISLPIAQLFVHPVDPVRDQAPNYYEISNFIY